MRIALESTWAHVVNLTPEVVSEQMRALVGYIFLSMKSAVWSKFPFVGEGLPEVLNARRYERKECMLICLGILNQDGNKRV